MNYEIINDYTIQDEDGNLYGNHNGYETKQQAYKACKMWAKRLKLCLWVMSENADCDVAMYDGSEGEKEKPIVAYEIWMTTFSICGMQTLEETTILPYKYTDKAEAEKDCAKFQRQNEWSSYKVHELRWGA